MRHGKKFNHLGRKSQHRKAMLSNMACSLIEHKRINTTLAKAKELRKYVEPLITKSKDDSTHSRRTVFSYLKNKEAVKTLFGEIAVKVGDRPGGYTRILKTGNRLGDNAEMCMIELVDYNENMLGETKKKSTRRRKKKTTEAPKAEAATEETVEEAVVVEEEVKEEPKAEASSEEAKSEEADSSKEKKEEE